VCSGFHVYTYEWTADYIAWFFDGMEIRRETGETATAFAQNATAGMQIHFNIWAGDASFGGTLDPSILPVHQYVDWIQFSSYADGAFTPAWREDFDGATLPSAWLTGDWGSPKNLSTHAPANVNFLSSCAVLSMTADGVTGPTGADPTGCTPGMGMAGAGGTTGQGGMAGTDAGASAGGAPGAGSGNAPAAGGMPEPGGSSGASGSGATGMTGSAGVSGAGAAGDAGGSGAVAAGASAGASSAGTAGTSGANPGATGGTSSSLGGSSTGDPPAGGGTESTEDKDTKDDDASGCGCRVPGSRSSQRGETAGAALVLALAGLFGRRRASRAPSAR